MYLFLTIPKKHIVWLYFLFTTLSCNVSNSQEFEKNSINEINNYLEYSPVFSSSGQVSKNDLNNLVRSGFQRVIYLAYNNQGKALLGEDRLVKDLGMQYVHIPVEWGDPTVNDFQLFASMMQQSPNSRTLLHCQVNYRASVFSFLYRVIYMGIDIKHAKLDMESIWMPNLIWKNFIFEVLKINQISPDCDECSW